MFEIKNAINCIPINRIVKNGSHLYRHLLFGIPGSQLSCTQTVYSEIVSNLIPHALNLQCKVNGIYLLSIHSQHLGISKERNTVRASKLIRAPV